MNNRIIFQSNDGGVSIVIPASECGLSIEEIASRVVPHGIPFEIVDVNSISSDRTFRNAWVKQGKTIITDMTKAKAIAHERRRDARSAEFFPLDIEATIPSKAAQAEAARQVIRDKYASMQTAMEAATTPDQLKALLP